MRSRLVLQIAVLILPLAAPAQAQQYVRLGSELDDYLRLLELRGTLSAAPLVFRSPTTLASLGPVARDTTHPWFAHHPFSAESRAPAGPALNLLDPDWRMVYNSRYPGTENDGALWAGRGASVALSLGARLRWGPVTAVLDPTFTWAQNRDFDLAPDSGIGVNRGGLSRFAYAWAGGGIDWPERFGDQAFARLDWGQTAIRLNLRPLTLGLSTENLWWGPAVRNPVLMSNTAAGFPHLDLGTGGPVWIGIGRAEARLLWGRLAESAYFDTIPWNDGRLLSGMVLGLQPRWVKGLSLGVTRVFYQTWDSLTAADFADIFQTIFKVGLSSPSNREGDDRRDQLLSLTARWTFPEAGFEAYVEWARNDHNWDLRDLLIEPDHSRAYTIGFQQLLPSGSGLVRLQGEFTTLGRPATFQGRSTPTYYTHYIVRQGYTHRGQLLGAGIGPGSQSQFFAADRYDQNGRMGVFLQRVRFDDDAYFSSFAPTLCYRGHQTELTAGVRAARFAGPLDLSARLSLSHQLNRHYQLDSPRPSFWRAR